MPRICKYIVCLLLSLTVLIGCRPSQSDATAEFGLICDDLTRHILTSDGITLNYSLSNPDAYEITACRPDLGEYGTYALLNEYAYCENVLSRLESIDKKTLSDSDSLTYDTICKTLSRSRGMDKYILYEEVLSPVSGIQTQLPILLAEYNFYDIEEIESYFHIIESIPAHFRSIIDYEKERARAGLFMDSRIVEQLINECNDFTANPRGNYLIEVFRDNISEISDITDAQIREYCRKNKELIINTLIPAYNELATALTELDEGKHTGGLCSLPYGRDYYAHLLCDMTGSDKSPEDIYELLFDTLEMCSLNITKTAASDPSIVNMLHNPTYPAYEPESIMEYLADNITCEFPTPADMSYAIKYVHPSLEDILSPAMYITPPIDTDSTDSIYINNASTDKSAIFPTLAHEGFPGHMYQTRYYMSSSPRPIRMLLNFGGYCEGWATYAELFSYDIAGLDAGMGDILKYNKLSTLCIYSLLDIGIHYYGWDEDKSSDLLADVGITDADIINEIYLAVLSEPGLYPKYTVSCIEFLRLRKKAEDRLKDSFDARAYHDFILRTGPTWFSLLDERLDKWLGLQSDN